MRMNDSLEKGVGGSMNLSDYVELKGIKSQIIMRFRIPEEEAVKYIKTFWKSEK